MKEKLEEIKAMAEKELLAIVSLKDLANFSTKYLGKQGELTVILRGMKDLSAEERPLIGALVNVVRNFIEDKIESTKKTLEEIEMNNNLQKESVDITEPSKKIAPGAIHPLYKILNQLIDLCVEMGFEVATGPEVESDYYNFEALNIPANHPARDMQDSFFITDKILLRTQTSCVQVREMEKRKPPIKIVGPGRTFRVDNDATHSPVFHQFEGLVVDENVSMVDLKAMLTKLLQNLFGENTKIRFRPSFFPFTEPSVEVDATCPQCGGKGCSRCKQTGWMELLGAGMVNPKVLENCGIDSKKYSGFAFGIGIDRLSMVINSIPDLRMMFENDVRFLNQMV
ncbi:MAG: phenylalanine--tRNA ligase subunit alpha [Clostridia bacterium]